MSIQFHKICSYTLKLLKIWVRYTHLQHLSCKHYVKSWWYISFVIDFHRLQDCLLYEMNEIFSTKKKKRSSQYAELHIVKYIMILYELVKSTLPGLFLPLREFSNSHYTERSNLYNWLIIKQHDSPISQRSNEKSAKRIEMKGVRSL